MPLWRRESGVRVRIGVVVLLLALGITGCGGRPGTGATDVGVTAPALPTVLGPVAVTPTSYPFLASAYDSIPIDLGQYGYSEQEFLVSGRANVYSWPDLATLGIVASGPYTTRILVRRPVDPARFSGNVRVEPLNPTAGHDLDPEWEIDHAGFMRDGDAYVGITVQPASITALKKFDPTRYGRLSMANPQPPDRRCDHTSGPSSERHSEDGLAWDIISQVGRLIRTDMPQNPLRDLPIRNSDLVGWSQSGSYDVTYLNAIARHTAMPDGKAIFDGYLPGAGSYAATPINQCAPVIEPGDPRVRYNPPNGVPVIVVSTPTDFYTAASYNRRTDRPDDSDTPDRRIRLYEIGGGSHLPGDHGRYLPSAAELARGGFAPETRTAYPLSSFPLQAVLDGAFSNLDNWVTMAVPPPHASRLTVADPDVWPVRAARDMYGNPVGGVRTPAVDVPTATYVERGLKAPGSDDSAYAGYDIPFSPGYLQVLYPTHQDYVDKVTADVRTLVAEHWLTQYGGEQLITQAQAASVPGG
ncbi:MAG TPA: alpha/beta hydrolase domain-containing protein [Pseudonocardia sp.]|nr:alpha/beta hydrolase domain-containing protein [Pseudonocardia sp.]